jgi:hypothetical protein
MNDTRARQRFILPMLGDLAKLEKRPECLTPIAYEWCSMIFENRLPGDWQQSLLICLEIGFRHFDVQCEYIETALTHTEHHRGLVDVVFKSQESEVIADLLYAWTVIASESHQPPETLLGSCTWHLVGLHHRVPFSSRLRQLVIRSVELIGYDGFKGVGVERFIELLNHLHVMVEDMGWELGWARLLLDTIQFSEGTQRLSHWYWKFLVESALSMSDLLGLDPVHGLRIIESLVRAEEWSKLECWIGIFWMLLPQEADAMGEEDLGRSMLLLFRQRPGAIQKLEAWMEQWDRRRDNGIPESFKQICKRAHEAAQWDAPYVSFRTR